MRYQSSPERPEGFWCVESFDLAEALTDQELKVLMQSVKLIHYFSGETIYFPGDSSETIYCLVDGRVGLSMVNNEGKHFTFAIVGHGQIFGESALVGEETRRWHAESLTDSNLCIVHRREFMQFARNNPRFALGITKLINNRLIEFENKVEDLVFLSADARLATTLLKLAEQFGVEEGAGVCIPFKLPNRELAKLIGASRETTSTLMVALKRQAIVTKHKGMLLIHDIQALENRIRRKNHTAKQR